MLTIGLTGGIGSGKSTVSKFLEELGAPILDADKVGHAIYQLKGPAYRDVVAAFGSKILAPDGSVDRAKLGPIVFADPAALKQLNDIVHPKMLQRMREIVEEMREGGQKLPIIVEAAILIEANWQPLCDEIWLVIAPREEVLKRVETQRGLNREQAEARIKSQLPDEQRRKQAKVVIDNSGTLEELRERVSQLWHQTLARAA